LLLVRRTRATLRIAEFGFLGVVVYTRVQTPRRCGQASSAGDFDLKTKVSRPLRTNCWIVGISEQLKVLLFALELCVRYRLLLGLSAASIGYNTPKKS